METDSLYYIMDYSGHYYRTDKADQLVAVAGEQDATVFTFAQANSRICVGKKAAFYCMVPIEENVEDMSREVSGSDEISDNFSALPVEEQEENNDEYVSPIKELTYDEVMEPIEKNVASYDLSEMDWAEYLTHFTYLVEGLKDYRDELSKKHSDVEQKICDILHYIELCETDDNEAVDLIELLRVCRENRRDIKDELQRIEYFQNSFGTNTNVTKAKQALKSIKGLGTRKYKPRKYEELFENCILKDRRLQRDDIHGTVHISSDTKQRYSVEPTFDEKDGEVTMVEERSYTPLDEKENDWVSFARQQAEFYRNAGQYQKKINEQKRDIEQRTQKIGMLEEQEKVVRVKIEEKKIELYNIETKISSIERLERKNTELVEKNLDLENQVKKLNNALKEEKGKGILKRLFKR